MTMYLDFLLKRLECPKGKSLLTKETDSTLNEKEYFSQDDESKES